MANYHILEKALDSRNAEVYLHLPIPATQTTAGSALSDATLTYRRALKEKLEKESESHTIISIVPGTDVVIPPATTSEMEDMQAGKLYEYHHSFRFSGLELTNAQRRLEVRNGNDNEIGVIQMLTDIGTPGTDIWNEVLEPLEWWGYKENV